MSQVLAALLLTGSKSTSGARPCTLATIVASVAAERWALRSLPLMHDPVTVRPGRDQVSSLNSCQCPGFQLPTPNPNPSPNPNQPHATSHIARVSTGRVSSLRSRVGLSLSFPHR